MGRRASPSYLVLSYTDVLVLYVERKQSKETKHVQQYTVYLAADVDYKGGVMSTYAQ